MKLFSAETYKQRRKLICEQGLTGCGFFWGNQEAPMNYTDNTYRFRQDSHFLYFFGINLPHLRASIDFETGETTLYGNDFTLDDIIWMGPQPSLATLAEKVGIDRVKPLSAFEKDIRASQSVHYLPPYRYDNLLEISELLQIHPKQVKEGASVGLIQAVVALRSVKTKEELEQMAEAVTISGKMHQAVMRAIRPGKFEYEMVAQLLSVAAENQAELAYPAIFSINGQTLHNHAHGNVMPSGRLALNDSGAENQMGYAGDITRTMPVDGIFTTKQKEIYEIVLQMEMRVIEQLRAGVFYKDMHLEANRILLQGLTNLGLVRGDIETLVQEGLGGLFMPHGLGHMIGLDVHDMEDLGEQYVGYTPDIQRSTQLGLKSLRLAKKLEIGNVLTVEPGIYFIPELIQKWKEDKRFVDSIDYAALETYLDFGGIRIEDNVVIESDKAVVLGEYIPKQIHEIEDLMKS